MSFSQTPGRGADGTPADAAARRDAASADAATTLWRERELLEHLLFTLTSQQLILAAGAIRWLTAADAQVQQAVEALTDCELRRAIDTTELAGLLDLPGDATLDQLAQAADEPWGALLGDHRQALRELTGEITAVTGENRRMLRAGADIARETLARVGSATAGYGDGSLRDAIAPILLDRHA